ncbi:MAG: hypothetical protein QOD99_1123 [Chthoniobacter sp.]|jgi:DNA-directed RNA polymerase subunit M/transcription elongation factor TFIIS|nr:hypothetical protein [Chthoniobacter sp.]
MLEQLITIATFNSDIPAEELKDRFLDAGLRAEVLDESGTQALFFSTREPRAHMRVRVPKADNDRAKALMAEWSEKESFMREAVRCPQCGSSQIEYPQFSRRTGMAWFFGVLAAIGVIPRLYFCEDCKFEWPDKEPAKLDLDPLNWPKGQK